jgi:hypothetical protein
LKPVPGSSPLSKGDDHRSGRAHSEGRNAAGKFIKGFKGGPGNPYASRVQLYRGVLFNALTPQDFLAVVLKLVEQAKRGCVVSQKLLLDRVLGRTSFNLIEELIRIQTNHDTDPNETYL